MDAATLAGTSQQDEVASQTAPNGAPAKFAWVLLAVAIPFVNIFLGLEL